MDYERKKELLTKENIKTDLKGLLYRDIRLIFLQSFSLLLFFVLFRMFLKLITVSTTVLDCVFAVIFIAYILGLVESIVLMIKVNQQKFSILTDELKETIEGRPYINIWFSYKPHILRFAICGKYNIPAGRNYKWSKLYNLNAREVFNASHIGGKFILVRINHKKILMAYNTRLFELVE